MTFLFHSGTPDPLHGFAPVFEENTYDANRLSPTGESEYNEDHLPQAARRLSPQTTEALLDHLGLTLPAKGESVHIPLGQIITSMAILGSQRGHAQAKAASDLCFIAHAGRNGGGTHMEVRLS